MKTPRENQQSISDNYVKGTFFALLSAFLFGFIPILAIYAYKEGVNVITFHFIRFTLASIALFALLFRKKGYQCFLLGKKDFLHMFVLGGILFTLTSFSYFSSFQYIPASMATLIFYSYPAVVAIVTVYINREPITQMLLASIILSSAGLFFLTGDIIYSISIKGVFLAGVASFSYTSYILYGNSLMKNISYQIIVAYVCSFSALSFLIAGVTTHNLLLSHTPSVWLIFCIISFVSVSGFLSFFLGVKLTTPAIAAILSMTEPLVTVILSIVFFREHLSFSQYFGGILVLTGSLIALLKGQ
ncbi:MAG TPA: permease [Aminobacterium sp.]|nr:permease [Aminobacterium sp.]